MKKKILITAFDFPPQWGGVATYSWELAHFFHGQGYQVTVVTRKREQTVEAPFKIIDLELTSSGLMSLPKMTFHLRKIIKNVQPFHIICTLWLPGAVSVYLSQYLNTKKIPYSIVVHAMEIVESNESFKKRLRQKIYFLKKACFNKAQFCFCVSHFTKALLSSTLPLDTSKVHVVNNGVNPDHFLNPQPKKSSYYPLLLTASRLVRNKGVDQVICSLPRLIKKFPQIHYRILGDGPDRQRLENLVKEKGVEKYVSFAGKVNHDGLIKAYNEAHLFVMLSRQEGHLVEGFGLVFLEAALSKTPSLGGFSGGIPDAIEENKTGWLVDPEDLQAIEQKLIEILSDPLELKKIGEQAFAVTVNNKTWQHQLSKIQGLIDA